MNNCQMCDFFWSGQAHTYYSLIAIVGLCLLASYGSLGPEFAFILIAALAGGVFVDEFLHGFMH
jgi:hypothetical protein